MEQCIQTIIWRHHSSSCIDSRCKKKSDMICIQWSFYIEIFYEILQRQWYSSSCIYIFQSCLHKQSVLIYKWHTISNTSNSYDREEELEDTFFCCTIICKDTFSQSSHHLECNSRSAHLLEFHIRRDLWIDDCESIWHYIQFPVVICNDEIYSKFFSMNSFLHSCDTIINSDNQTHTSCFYLIQVI